MPKRLFQEGIYKMIKGDTQPMNLLARHSPPIFLIITFYNHFLRRFTLLDVPHTKVSMTDPF